ncbi:BZIP domain-containing protein [Hirschfeldia incana]|nr:BZIP domain-containing protein [Hirschfeldia incana]
MASSKGTQNVKDLMHPGKNALLPPKIPFPTVSAPYSEYIPLSSRHQGHKLSDEKPHGHHHHHQRTSSESDLVEEPPSWLDDLLNEPESPVRKCGHRRSSSDSYAYLDMANAKNISLTLQNDFSYRNTGASSSQRGVHELDWNQNAQGGAFYSDSNFLNQTNRQRDSLVASGGHRPSWQPFTRESVGGKHMGASSYMPQEATETKNYAKTLSHDAKKFSPEQKHSNTQPGTSDADNTRRAKQQFAQRSRVRKLQYISELERTVQALQAEGSKVSADLDFLNQRNLILSMENKALKQRLESIAQEKLIKQLEQELLEKEIGRLRALYQQQQQQQQTQQPSASHKRTSSKDLDSQFSSLSLNSKDSNSTRDSVSVTSQFHF